MPRSDRTASIGDAPMTFRSLISQPSGTWTGLGC
jgi:hypothetical protein